MGIERMLPRRFAEHGESRASAAQSVHAYFFTCMTTPFVSDGSIYANRVQ